MFSSDCKGALVVVSSVLGGFQGVANMQLLKGIVHPKMKILSSFTHPQVVPNLYEGRYFEESL